MRTFLQLEDDGQTIKHYVSLFTNTAPAGWTEIVSAKDKTLLKRSSYMLKYVGNAVHLRDVVRITSDKAEIVADGIDIATITFHDVPESVSSFFVQYGGEVAEVPRGETLELSSSAEGTIVIRVDHRDIYASPIAVRAAA